MGKIVFLGDSLTQAVEVSLESRWPYKLGISCGYQASDIINSGISGNKTSQMQARLAADVFAHNPEVCVVMPTVNDRTNGVVIATAEQQLRQMIAEIQANGVKVTVVSPPLYTTQLDQWKPWVEMWEDVAGDLGCHWVDCWREFVYASYYQPSNWFPYYYTDYVHMTANGNALIHSICMRLTHTGAFVKDAPATNPDGECQEPCSERSLALADLLENGATIARLQRVISSLEQ